MKSPTGAPVPSRAGNSSLYRTEHEQDTDQVSVQQDAAYLVSLYGKEPDTPPFCTCCMKRSARLETITAGNGKKKNDNAAADAGVRFPVCDECANHRKELRKKRNLVWFFSVLAGVLVMLALMVFVKPDDWIPVAAGGGAFLFVYVLLYFGLKLKYLPVGHSSRFESVLFAPRSETKNASASSLYHGGSSAAAVSLLFTNPRYARALYDTNERLISEPQEVPMPNSARTRSIAKLDRHKLTGFLRALISFLILASVGMWLNSSFGFFRNISFEPEAAVIEDGLVSGLVRDAVTGNAAGQVQIRLYTGPDAVESGPFATCVTGDDGMYSLSVPAGLYHTTFDKDGYEPASLSILAVGGQEIRNQNCAISPLIESGQIRIILEWGQQPYDLDSHLINKQQGLHVFYNHLDDIRSGDATTNLDLDDRESYGPETITILSQLDGEYVYCVHDFSNYASNTSTALGASGARVTVYTGRDSARVFQVPNEPGTCWKVFALVDGTVTPINEMSFVHDPGNVGR